MDFFDTLNDWMGDVGTAFSEAFGVTTETAAPFEGLPEEAPGIEAPPMQDIPQTEIELPKFDFEEMATRAESSPDEFRGWFGSLDQSGQRAVLEAIRGAAGGGMQALQQRNAQEMREEEREREREDQRRRGQVAPVRPGQYSAKPSAARGLIASQMGG